MKRTLCLPVLLLLLAAATGCGRSGGPAPTYTPPSATHAQTEPATESAFIDIPELPTPQPQVTEPETTATEAPTEVPTEAPDQSSSAHSRRIEQIRQWYRDIVYDDSLVTETFGTSAKAYFHAREIVKIEEYEQLNDDMNPALQTTHFYYHNGQPFFIFIEYDNWYYEEIRLYFDENGQLIRWIEDKNQPQDNIPNEHWQDYYYRAQAAMENIF